MLASAWNRAEASTRPYAIYLAVFIVHLPILTWHAHKTTNGQKIERVDGMVGVPIYTIQHFLR